MNRKVRKDAAAFKREHGLHSVTSVSLTKALEQEGFTVILFSPIGSNREVQQLIELLKLTDQIQLSNGFTYWDTFHRLVFVNEDLSERERVIVLAHEAGHIVCRHQERNLIAGSEVYEEFEASEFAHYLLHRDWRHNFYSWVSEFRLAIIWTTMLSLVLFVAISGSLLLTKEREATPDFGEYYVTSHGTKFHEKDCIFVKHKNNIRQLTLDEFNAHIYEECQICLPLESYVPFMREQHTYVVA